MRERLKLRDQKCKKKKKKKIWGGRADGTFPNLKFERTLSRVMLLWIEISFRKN